MSTLSPNSVRSHHQWRPISFWYTICHTRRKFEIECNFIALDIRGLSSGPLLQDPTRSAAEQIRRDLLAGIDEALHGTDRFIEGFAVLAGQLNLDNPLDTLRPNHDGHADIHVLHAIFAVEVGGAGHHALLVLEIALGHRDRGSRRRIEGRAGFEEDDDLGTASAG